MRSVDPEPSALDAYRRDAQAETPVVMINLLRYRERAVYPDDFAADPCSGREAYQRYGAVAAKLIGESGGRPLWMGNVNNSLIAPDDESWDDAILVYYPSREHFVNMLESDEYQAVMPHRSAALEDSRLIETTTVFGPGME